MACMRAVVLVIGALALGPALAARQGGALADECRAAFHEVIPFHNFLVVGSGVEFSSETDSDAYLASRAAALALCGQAAAQDSASSSSFSTMPAAPAAERDDPVALFSMLHHVFNYANEENGHTLGPRDLASAERYCEFAVRKSFKATPASMCSSYFGHAYAEQDNALGLDYGKSAYWLALLTNRVALEGYKASSEISARLDLSLAEFDEEERTRVLEVALIERMPICDEPYNRARFSSYVRCAEHNALEKQQQ